MNMIKKVLIILSFNILILPAFSQTGGDNIYEFLNLTHSGLVSSLGGTNVSLHGSNLNLASQNPGLLNSNMRRSLALNYVNYFAGINYGQVLYSGSLSGTGTFAGGLTYLNYGSFVEADASGLITGSFKASEYAFLLIYSRAIDSLFTVGINIKPVLSHLERYTSFGFAVDFGASWHNRSDLFSAGIVIKNAGYQVTSYAGESKQKLPFEIQGGFSQKLNHAPFRFSLTLRHLEKFNLTHKYSSSGSKDETAPETNYILENILRHMTGGVEIIPHKNFYFSGGYNYKRRSELMTNNGSSTAGFSWGFGVNTSWLNFEFGRAMYHLAGSANHVSMIIRPDNIYKRTRQ
jgi:hypothetical protein